MKHAKGFLAITQDAKRRIKEVTASVVNKRMEKGEAFALIDVREDNEWKKGHIKGAAHIGKGVIERDIEENIPDPNTEIILYCGGGYRSALAAENLQRMGYKNVYSMKGGWREWNTRGFPISGKAYEKH